MNNLSSLPRQRGATLLISLALLLVLTILALAAGRSATLQQRMAGNQQQQNLAFQAAENGIQAAIVRLQKEPNNRPPINGEKCLRSEAITATVPAWIACTDSTESTYYHVKVEAKVCPGNSIGSSDSSGYPCYIITSTGQADSVTAVHQQGYVF